MLIKRLYLQNTLSLSIGDGGYNCFTPMKGRYNVMRSISPFFILINFEQIFFKQ